MKVIQDVSGAIFIATCVFLPDLIYNLIEAFLECEDFRPSFLNYYIYYPLIIGPAIFNILIPIGAGCFAAKEPLR